MRWTLYKSVTHCSVLLLLMLSTYINCVPMPIDVIYTGESCACPTQMGYQLKMPNLPNPKKYATATYDYRIEAPIPIQPKVMYRLDLTVEEPQEPRPTKQNKLHLYAKIDRITATKRDCIPPAPTILGCTCGQCGFTQPQYRYVEQKVPPCKCHYRQCKCNAKSQAARLVEPILPKPASLESIVKTAKSARTMPSIHQSSSPDTVPCMYENLGYFDVVSNDNGQKIDSNPNPYLNAISRRKRELQNVLFRKRFLYNSNERSPRYVKMYHKDLSSINSKYSLFGLADSAPSSVAMLSKASGLAASDSIKLKRKTKKGSSPEFATWKHSRRRLIKRDIKGEYDHLEHERENADMTLPEIIQYMPETQQANFKRGQCHFGCAMSLHQLNETEQLNSNEADTTADTTPATIQIDNGNSNNDERHMERYKKKSIKIKRDTVVSEYSVLPYFGLHAYKQIPVPLASTIYASIPNDKYEFLLDDSPLSAFLSTTSVPDPLESGSKPLKFAGDLEAITPFFQQLQGNWKFSANNAESLISKARSTGLQYPVEHISNEQLERVISNIVYRHPEFIDATSHYGGVLNDPEALQKEQTKKFLKKLIDGRFGLWHEEDFNFFPLPRTSVESLALTYSPAAGSSSGSSKYNYAALSPLSFLPGLF